MVPVLDVTEVVTTLRVPLLAEKKKMRTKLGTL